MIGLSHDQATLLLSTKGLNQAQIDLILSNDEVSASQLTEAATLDGVNIKKNVLTTENQKQLISSKLLTTEKLAEISATIGLETAEDGSLIAKKALNAEMVKQQLESLGVVGSAQSQILSMLGLTTAEMGATTASNVLSGALAKLNIALATNPIGVLVTAIGIAIGSVFLLKKGFDAVTDSSEEISERADDLISKYTELKNTADANAKTVESIADEYSLLSKGVNELGENVSLTSDEYTRYNELTNQIAEMFPKLVSGYTSEGNAILTLKGNVEGLRDAYKEAQQEAYNTLLATGKDDNGNDIMEDYKNLSELDWWDAPINTESVTTTVKRNITKQILDLMSDMDASVDEYNKLAKDIFDKYGSEGYNFLKEMGLSAITDIFSDTTDITQEALIAGRATVKSYYQGFQSEIDSKIGNVRLIANAFLNTNDYYNSDSVSANVKNLLSLVVNSIDEETANSFNGDIHAVGAFVNTVVDGFQNATPEISKAISDLFTNTELSPGDKNNLIKQIQDYFGKDNSVSIFLQPQFEENETTQKNIDNAIAEAQRKFNKDEIRKQLEGYNKEDTIDFTIRPVIDTSKLKEKGWDDVGEGTATVFSSTYYSEDFGLEEGTALVVTPILPNGDVLTEEELNEYARKILSGEEVDVDIKMGMFDGDNYKAEADEFANKIHELHEKYFDDSYIDWNKYFKDQSIDTQEELDKWNEVTKGCNTATEAMEAWKKAATNSTDTVTASLDKLSKQLDEVQSAYDTVRSVMKEYNETGIMTVDNMQAILSLDNKYLSMLFNEEGQLDLTSEALKRHSLELMRNMAIKKMQDYISYIDSLGVEQAEHLLTATAIDKENESLQQLIVTMLTGSAVFGELSVDAQTALVNQISSIYKLFEASAQNWDDGSIYKDSASNAKQAAEAREDYAEKVADLNEQLAEKEAEFAEKMQEAWEEEHLESLKENLEQRADILDRYAKRLEYK